MNVNILQSILLGYSGMLTGSVDQGAFGCFRSILVGYSQGCLVYRMVDGEACWRYVYMEPQWPLFWRSSPQIKAFSNQKKSHLGSMYIYTLIFQTLKISRVYDLTRGLSHKTRVSGKNPGFSKNPGFPKILFQAKWMRCFFSILFSSHKQSIDKLAPKRIRKVLCGHPTVALKFELSTEHANRSNWSSQGIPFFNGKTFFPRYFQCIEGTFEPVKKSRVVMGKSWVCHG